MRLPAHLEVSAVIRLAQSEGGFATVLNSGERDAGTLLIVTIDRGSGARLFERMPQLDGSRSFVQTKVQDPEKTAEFFEYIDRRSAQDPDIWVIEVDIADPERLIANLAP